MSLSQLETKTKCSKFVITNFCDEFVINVFYKTIYIFETNALQVSISKSAEIYNKLLDKDFEDKNNIDLKEIFNNKNIEYRMHNDLFVFKNKESCNKAIEILDSILLINALSSN